MPRWWKSCAVGSKLKRQLRGVTSELRAVCADIMFITHPPSQWQGVTKVFFVTAMICSTEVSTKFELCQPPWVDLPPWLQGLPKNTYEYEAVHVADCVGKFQLFILHSFDRTSFLTVITTLLFCAISSCNGAVYATGYPPSGGYMLVVERRLSWWQPYSFYCGLSPYKMLLVEMMSVVWS